MLAKATLYIHQGNDFKRDQEGNMTGTQIDSQTKDLVREYTSIK